MYSPKQRQTRQVCSDGKSLPVPMTFRILVQWRKHNGQYGLNIITDQVAEVFIVPEVECSFGDLTQNQLML